MKTILNWSSGKDAALAYALLLEERKYDVAGLLTTVSAGQERVVMHGVRERLLDMQAQRMRLPLTKIYLPASPDDGEYKRNMQDALLKLKAVGVTHAAFGDIFLQDLRTYREQQLADVGISAVFPLWQKDTRQLIQLLGQKGIEAMIVCVNERYLSKDFLGRKIGASFLEELPDGVDPCGENGEFHTFVYNAPYFSEPIPIIKKETVYRKYDQPAGSWDTGFYFLDIDVEAG